MKNYHYTHQGLKYNGKYSFTVEDDIALEKALQVNINGKPFTITMRTPGNETDLIRGLLYTEDIYCDDLPLEFKILEKDEHNLISIINVWIPAHQIGKEFYNRRSMLSVSSCGICGKKELTDLKNSGNSIEINEWFHPEIIPEMYLTLNKTQSSFIRTGGTHAAAAFDINGNLLVLREDIGRHNAVDKVVGGLLINQQLSQAKFMLVSGRISYEIVNKTYQARIPILAAVSAPSSMSLEYADAMGISLLAYCRDQNMTCYTHSQRMKTKSFQTINSNSKHVEELK